MGAPEIDRRPDAGPKTDAAAGRSLGFALLLFCGALIVLILPRACPPSEGPLVGKIAPDFTLAVARAGDAKATLPGPANRAEDAPFALAALRGHPVLLDFWATWCGPCQMEAPVVDRVARTFHERGLAVVGVNTSDAEGKAAPWANAHRLGYPIVYDLGDEVANAYGVSSLPTLVLVGRDGKVRAVRVGMASERELNALVTDALE